MKEAIKRGSSSSPQTGEARNHEATITRSNSQILMITGPGGTGKSPLGQLIKKDGVFHLEPYRLRKNGPRDTKDFWYANPMLLTQLECIAEKNGDTGICFSCSNFEVTWYPKTRFAKYKVREEWQILLIPDVPDLLIKMEIYAPALVALLDESKIPDFKQLLETLGELKIIILNPANKSLMDENGVTEDIASLTHDNCIERGDDMETAEKRKKSVYEEIKSWQDLIRYHNAIELTGWQYPEYKWKASSVKDQDVIDCILDKDKTLSKFFQ
jgi:hypothetical protein